MAVVRGRQGNFDRWEIAPSVRRRRLPENAARQKLQHEAQIKDRRHGNKGEMDATTESHGRGHE